MDHLISQLSHLGFTPMDSRVYLTILDNPDIGGYQVAKLLGVPRSTVYACLDRLQDSGALYSIPGETQSFRCRDPQVFLDEFEASVRRKNRTLKDLLENRGPRIQAQPFLNLQGWNTVMAEVRDLLRRAEREILLNLGVDPRPFEQELISAAGRGVRVVVFTFRDLAEVLPGGEIYQSHKLGHRPAPEWSLLMVCDMAHGLIADGIGEQGVSATRSSNLFFCRTLATNIHLDIYIHKTETLTGRPLEGYAQGLNTLLEESFRKTFPDREEIPSP